MVCFLVGHVHICNQHGSGKAPGTNLNLLSGQTASSRLLKKWVWLSHPLPQVFPGETEGGPCTQLSVSVSPRGKQDPWGRVEVGICEEGGALRPPGLDPSLCSCLNQDLAGKGREVWVG